MIDLTSTDFGENGGAASTIFDSIGRWKTKQALGRDFITIQNSKSGLVNNINRGFHEI